jgi:protein TonB
LCRVGGSLRCMTGNKLWSKPAPDTGAQRVSRKAPKCAHCPNPKFPEAERLRRVEGSVLVLTEIGKDGRPGAIVVLAAQTADFAAAALRTLRKWRFHPALKAGKPIAVTAQVLLNFHLYAQ